MSVKATDSAVTAADGEPLGYDYTLAEWLEEWLGLCAVRGLRRNTVAGYRRVLGLYVSAELAARDLRAIRAREINRMYQQLLTSGRRYGSGGLSAATVRQLHTLLQKALSDAVRLELLDRNPALAADPPSRRAARAPAFAIWSPAELRAFLDAVRTDEHYAALHLAAFTGLRRSELLGLRWRDLDLGAGQLQVVQTVVLVDWKAEFGPPKTDRSRRLVALDRNTVEVLHQYRRSVESACGAKVLNPNGLIFAEQDGSPIHPAMFAYHFQRLIKRAGVPRIRFHDLRHSHASHALAAGVHPKIVSERLGHSSISITLDLYSHTLPGLQREAAETVALQVYAESH